MSGAAIDCGGIPRAGTPARMNAASASSSRADRRDAIGGPVSPPFPFAPWHGAHRVSNVLCPGLAACAAWSGALNARDSSSDASMKFRLLLVLLVTLSNFLEPLLQV